MVEIFSSGVNLLLCGAALGGAIGWTFHAVFIRWYLHKHMKSHPEYKIFIDLLEKN